MCIVRFFYMGLGHRQKFVYIGLALVGDEG